MLCQFCGKSHDVDVKEYKDPKTSVMYIMCFKCLSELNRCEVCNTLAVTQANMCLTCISNKNLVVCKFCGKLTDTINEHVACPACTPFVKECANCHRWHTDMYLSKEGSICVLCVGKYEYKYCDACKMWVLPKNYALEYLACKSCASTTQVCLSCGLTFIQARGHKLEQEWVCGGCYSHSECSSCGESSNTFYYKLPSTDTTYNVCVCLTCFKNKKYGVIKNYGYKPEGKFKTAESPAHPTLFLGIENEVNFQDKHYPQERVCVIFDEKEHHWYIKRDGSVSNGFEIVTHPMQYEYIKQSFPIESLFPKDFGIIKSSECGMHIHLSKNAFTNAHLFKFMQFWVNEPAYCEKIAERPSNSYCSKLGKQEVIDKAIRKAGGARNQVNLGPPNTVEVRAFKGATTPEQYLKNIEFVYALFCFSKIYSIAKLNKENFEEYLLKERDKFPNLIKFLKLSI